MIDEAAHFIPSGMNVWEGRQERFDLTALRCFRETVDIIDVMKPIYNFKASD